MELQEDCYRLQQVLKDVEPNTIIQFLRKQVSLADTEIRCQLALQHFFNTEDDLAKQNESYEVELKADYLCIKHLLNTAPDEEIQELLKTLGPIPNRKYVAVRLLLQKYSQTTRKKRKNGSKHTHDYEASRKLVKTANFDKEADSSNENLEVSKEVPEQRESLILTFKNVKDKNGNDKFMVTPLNRTVSENGPPKNSETEDQEMDNQEDNDSSVIEVITSLHDDYGVPAIKPTQSVVPFLNSIKLYQNKIASAQNEAGPSHQVDAESHTEDNEGHNQQDESAPFQQNTTQSKPEPPQSIAGTSHSIAGPSQSIAGPSQSIAGPSQSIAGPSQSIAGPSQSIAGPSQSLPGLSQGIPGQPKSMANPFEIKEFFGPELTRKRVVHVNYVDITEQREPITPTFSINQINQAINLSSVPSDSSLLNKTFIDSKQNTDNSVNLSKKPRVIDEKLVLKLIEVFPQACPDYIREICDGKTYSEANFDDIVSIMFDSGDYPRRPERQPSPPKAVDPEEQLNTLKEIFGDADPSWLQQKVEQFAGDPEALNRFIAETMESRNYPTMKDYLRKQQLSAQQRQYTTEFNVERFVELIPDPKSLFEDPERKSPIIDPTDKCYIKWSMRNRYKKLYAKDIHNIVEKEGMNIISIVNALELLAMEGTNKKSTSVSATRPDIQNIPLLQELAYFEHKDEIIRHIENKKKQAEQERQNAKELGLMQQCSCCFDDEVMPNDILTCTGGCRFCRDCIKKGNEVAFSDGKVEFTCLANCGAEFSLQVLQSVLPPKVFSKLAQKKAVAEVTAAGVEDLETCPFCDFATIPAPEDRLFRCLNPDCMKESCRLCKEPSHVPLRCDEVEKDEAVKARTYIEDKMTKALIRECWKCKTKFIKDEGCNKMTCQCGAIMCYVCRKPVTSYKHFNGQGGDRFDLCPLYTDNFSVNEKNVLKAAEEAKREINPAQLINDPTADLQKHFGESIKKAKKQEQQNPFRLHMGALHLNGRLRLQYVERVRHDMRRREAMILEYNRRMNQMGPPNGPPQIAAHAPPPQRAGHAPPPQRAGHAPPPQRAGHAPPPPPPLHPHPHHHPPHPHHHPPHQPEPPGMHEELYFGDL